MAKVLREVPLLTVFLAGAANVTAQKPAPTLRVFLLAGQSNMEGQAVVDLDGERDYNGGRGNLEKFLVDPSSSARPAT